MSGGSTPNTARRRSDWLEEELLSEAAPAGLASELASPSPAFRRDDTLPVLRDLVRRQLGCPKHRREVALKRAHDCDACMDRLLKAARSGR